MIVEDGTGKVDANSYVDVAYADGYFSARGETAWAELTTTNKEYALVKGTDFIDNSFDWYGKKKTQEQSLRFPRTALFDSDGYEVDGLPKSLKDAVCEASLKGLTSTLYTEQNSNGAVTSEHIGDLSFSYDVSKVTKDTTLYDSINLRLRGLFKDKSKPKIYAINVKRTV